ncbi:MAG TPA: tetratricopeptide repeat protein [Pseudomonadales bacterium]|nr:tetratricopeptide repeat protein [Pseudomonadales bacterium]
MSPVLLGIVCALGVMAFGWISHSALLPARPQNENTFYNLLTQGFRAGQLNVITQAPPELARMANPYIPASFAPYSTAVYDLSYYHGKLYLYWGITPVVVLFWPYTALTGDYLSDADAITIFLSLGFLIAIVMINTIHRRYFPEAPAWLALICILIFGICLATQEMEWQFSAVYQVALSSGFAFTMASLAAIGQAMHRSKRQILWLLLASAAFGLALESRPSLLFGGIILLIPVIQVWRADGRSSPMRTVTTLAAAAVPLTLVIFGMLLYNQMRFNSPFEFGVRYQLNPDQLGPVHRFGLRYFFFNFYFYFFEPLRWAWHFPFVQTIPDVTFPSGYSPIGKSFGGILLAFPLVWLALAAPLAWRGQLSESATTLHWLVIALFLLFVAETLTICLFADSFPRYAMDFLPALLLLSVIGIFALEGKFRNSLSRRTVRMGWSLLLIASVALSLFGGIAALADVYGFGASVMVSQGEAGNAIPYFQKALALNPSSAQLHFALGSAYHQTGWDEQAVAEFEKALEIDPALPQAGLMRENVADYFFDTGQWSEAIPKYEKAIEISPRNGALYYNLGRALFKTGRVGEAIPQLKQALDHQPSLAADGNLTDNNDMAWLLATSPDLGQRNGPLAVKLAEGVCKKTDYRETATVGTLAAAYAEAGQFDNAISTAQKAIVLARQNNQQELLQNNQVLLALYLKHQPYHAR